MAARAELADRRRPYLAFATDLGVVDDAIVDDLSALSRFADVGRDLAELRIVDELDAELLERAESGHLRPHLLDLAGLVEILDGQRADRAATALDAVIARPDR